MKKSFHAGGNTLAILDCHNCMSYNEYVNTDTTGTFFIGLDLEQFSGKGGQIISVLDTSSSDLFISWIWWTGASILEDYYSHYNSVLVIVDG